MFGQIFDAVKLNREGHKTENETLIFQKPKTVTRTIRIWNLKSKKQKTAHVQ